MIPETLVYWTGELVGIGGNDPAELHARSLPGDEEPRLGRAPVPPVRSTCFTCTDTYPGTHLSNLQDTPVSPMHSQALSQARTCPTCKIHLSYLYTPMHFLRHAHVTTAIIHLSTSTPPGTLSGTHLSHLYEVIEEEEVVVTSQWDMAGSLLFAITVITTIGTHTMRYICIYTGARMAPWLTQNVAQRR